MLRLTKLKKKFFKTFWIPELLAENNYINGTKLAKVLRMANISDSFRLSLESKGDILEEDWTIPFKSRIYEEDSFVDFCEGNTEKF